MPGSQGELDLGQAEHEPVEVLQLPGVLAVVRLGAAPVELGDPDGQTELAKLLDQRLYLDSGRG